MTTKPPSEPLECIIRPATSLEEATDIWWPLILHLGWNRSLTDAQTHYISTTAHSGPSGFLIVANASTPNEAEGCILPFVYANKTGWIGFFCLNGPVRGQKWGAKLFQAGLDVFKKNGTEIVGLDAVSEQVATYGRRGFVEKARIRLMQRNGTKETPLAGTFEHVAEPDLKLCPLEEIPSKILVASDLAHTGFERTALWTQEALLNREDTFGLALVKEGKSEELEGWILVRECQLGYRFGPLYANSKANATLLLHQAMRRLESEDGNFIVEVWPQNEQAVKVFEETGWSNVGIDYHRMWLNGVVPEPQRAGGKADKEVYAMFDAGEG